MEKEVNKTENYLHLSVKISESSSGNFNKSKIKKEKEEFDIKEQAFILLKNNNKIISEESQAKIEDNENLLFLVRPKGEYMQLENNFIKNSFKLTEDNINSLNYKLWYVIKTYPEDEKNNNNIIEDNINEDYYLCENDIIRLGNFKFVLREIHLKNKNTEFFTNYKKNNLKYDIHDINKNNNPVFEFIPKLDFYILNTNEKITCRICNQSTCDLENPIVSLCSCDSYKNRHYKCLKEEFKEQIKIIQNKNKTSTNYLLKCHCKTCETQLPLNFIIEKEKVKKTYELIDFNKPEENDYLFFESLEYIREGSYEKSFHLIKLNDDNITITIGRDGSLSQKRDNDLKIYEPTVSRGIHAVIEYNKNEGSLLLKNKNSKFGTLIAIKEELKINKNKILLQIGRTSIEACLINKNDIPNINKIKTRKEYDDEIIKQIEKKKIEEEEKRIEKEEKRIEEDEKRIEKEKKRIEEEKKRIEEKKKRIEEKKKKAG